MAFEALKMHEKCTDSWNTRACRCVFVYLWLPAVAQSWHTHHIWPWKPYLGSPYCHTWQSTAPRLNAKLLRQELFSPFVKQGNTTAESLHLRTRINCLLSSFNYNKYNKVRIVNGRFWFGENRPVFVSLISCGVIHVSDAVFPFGARKAEQ